MYKILALDIDGTLTNSAKEVTPKVKEALYRLYEKNIPVLLVSGRPTEGILPIAKEIDLEENGGYILAFNGGKIINAKTKEVIYQKSVPYEYVKEICDFAVENDLAVLTYKDGDIITNKPMDEYVQIEARINRLKAVEVEAFVGVGVGVEGFEGRGAEGGVDVGFGGGDQVGEDRGEVGRGAVSSAQDLGAIVAVAYGSANEHGFSPFIILRVREMGFDIKFYVICDFYIHEDE